MDRAKITVEKLGMSQGAAANKLRKMIMFKYAKACGDDICFRCGMVIDNIDDLSIEHKETWFYSHDPAGRFFDLDNIAFSHMKCNRPDNPRGNTKPRRHGLDAMYDRGCRCDECREFKSGKNRKRIRTPV